MVFNIINRQSLEFSAMALLVYFKIMIFQRTAARSLNFHELSFIAQNIIFNYRTLHVYIETFDRISTHT